MKIYSAIFELLHVYRQMDIAILIGTLQGFKRVWKWHVIQTNDDLVV
jgi:hypothetical protein